MEYLKQQGLTIIQLMVSIAIVGILSAIGASVYANYTNKARVAEAFVFGVKAIKDVSQYYALHDSNFGATANEFNASLCPKLSTLQAKHIAKVTPIWVTSKQAIVDITFSQDNNSTISGKTIRYTLRPSPAGGVLSSCTSNLSQTVLPNTCNYSESVANGVPDYSNSGNLAGVLPESIAASQWQVDVIGAYEFSGNGETYELLKNLFGRTNNYHVIAKVSSSAQDKQEVLVYSATRQPRFYIEYSTANGYLQYLSHSYYWHGGFNNKVNEFAIHYNEVNWQNGEIQ